LRTFNRLVVLAPLASLVLVFFFLFGWAQAGLAEGSPFGSMLNRATLLTIFLLLGAGCIFARQRRLTGMRTLMVALLLVVVFDLFTVNWRNSFQATHPLEEYGPRALVAPIQADGGTFRVYNEWRLPGNYGMIYEVEDIGGASPLRLSRYEALVTALPRERVWQLTNVKYVITWRGTLLPETELLYEESTGEDTTYLHRLQEYLPRAWVVHHAEVLPCEEALDLLADPDFDPLETVILEEESDLTMAGEASPSGSTVSILEREATRIILQAQLVQNGVLVLSENHYPGWRAFVDGQQTRIHRANYTLRALELEAGSHRVELVYDPLSVKVGCLVSLGALIVVLCVAARTVIRRASQRS